MNIQRRQFIQWAGASSTLAGVTSWAQTTPSRRVVVVGGGFGGTLAAKTLRLQDPSLEVMLIEPQAQYVAFPSANLYLAGLLPDLRPLTFSYDKLASQHGIKLIHDTVSSIQPDIKALKLTGKTLHYDRLILSPGVGLRLDGLPGYNPASTPKTMPHAWTDGAQTELLRQQLQAMPDGGTVLLSIPLPPLRYPVGAYERACMIALYLQQAKPKSKLIVLDANPEPLAHSTLFKTIWEKQFANVLEYRAGQSISAVNDADRSLTLNGGEVIKGAVVNLIPPQRAARIALITGLAGANKIWCPVHANTFESVVHPGIHVIGDACQAGDMPKSGFAANSQAKICALNLVALMNGKEVMTSTALDTSFSQVNASQAISQIGHYTPQDDKLVVVPNVGGASTQPTEAESLYRASWVKNILTEMSS